MCSLLEPYTVYACGQSPLSENHAVHVLLESTIHNVVFNIPWLSWLLTRHRPSTTEVQTLPIHDVKAIVLIWEYKVFASAGCFPRWWCILYICLTPHLPLERHDNSTQAVRILSQSGSCLFVPFLLFVLSVLVGNPSAWTCAHKLDCNYTCTYVYVLALYTTYCEVQLHAAYKAAVCTKLRSSELFCFNEYNHAWRCVSPSVIHVLFLLHN